jgi:hypothetical protein
MEGLRLCDEVMALDPAPFDGAAARAIRGHALTAGGDGTAGAVLLEGVLEWLERSHLRYTHCLVAVWLGEAYLASGARDRARSVLRPALEQATALGYRHLEGVAHRLLAESLDPDEPAAYHLELALARLREVGAQRELVRALVIAAHRARRLDRADEVRGRVSEACAVLERLGAHDEANRMRLLWETSTGVRAPNHSSP